MSTPTTTTTAPRSLPRIRPESLLVLAASLFGLAYYKWSGAATAIAGVRRTGAWTRSADALIHAATVPSAEFYIERIAVALVFGVLLGAGLRLCASPAIIERLTAGGSLAQRQLVAAGSGVPLMLCSCCITPVFSAADEAGAPVASSLALMLASPALNPAALVLTAMLFPARIAVARLLGALIIVLAVPLLAERIVGQRRAASRDVRVTPLAPGTGTRFVAAYLRSLWRTAIESLPIIIAGVLASALLIQRGAQLGVAQRSDALVLAAALMTLVALPTYFEIPIALLAASAGAPALAAVILIAGPAVNLPSILTVWRRIGMKAAIVLATGVWLVALMAGLAVRA